MKPGDLVMFNSSTSRYAKWFYGRFGIVESVTPSLSSCRVRWLHAVKYYDKRTTTYSDFECDKFEVYGGGQ